MSIASAGCVDDPVKHLVEVQQVCDRQSEALHDLLRNALGSAAKASTIGGESDGEQTLVDAVAFATDQVRGLKPLEQRREGAGVESEGLREIPQRPPIALPEREHDQVLRMCQSEWFEDRAVQGDDLARGDGQGEAHLPLEGEGVWQRCRVRLDGGHTSQCTNHWGTNRWITIDSVSDDQIIRPNPFQWVRFVYLGSVPRKNAAWVLYDATCKTWILRHIVRYVVLISPFVLAVMLLLPADMGIRIETSFAAGASIGLGYVCYTSESLEARLEKAGYPRGLAARMREQRTVDAHRAVVARNRARREARLRGHRQA